MRQSLQVGMNEDWKASAKKTNLEPAMGFQWESLSLFNAIRRKQKSNKTKLFTKNLRHWESFAFSGHTNIKRYAFQIIHYNAK